jgi:Raf kinase inhibitor-like YbhB/YbcL family protein
VPTRRHRRLAVLAVAAALLTGAGPAAAATTFKSPAFAAGTPIPRKFTCDGVDTSPPLKWSGAPASTVEFAVLVTDPDASGFVHWVVAGIPGGRSQIPRGTGDAGAAKPYVEGRNSFGKVGWDGPCPPSGTHHYRFTLYASPAHLGLTGHPKASKLRAAAKAAGASHTSFSATYHR